MAARRNPAPEAAKASEAAPGAPESSETAPAPEAEGEEELAQSSPEHAPPLPLDDEAEEGDESTDEKSDAPAAEGATAPEAESEALYFVAPRHSINTRSRDLQKPGARIYPSDFFHGQDRIDQLVAAGVLEKR